MGQRLSEESDSDQEIDVAELQEWYKKFVVECPSGTLYMHEFKSFFGVTNNEAADYIENMFRAFDKNGDNTIDFLEYVAALNLVLRGKLEHKLKWTFKMYDKDGSGCIDKTELLEIVELTSHIMSTVSEEPVSSIDKYKNAEGGWSLRHVKRDLFSCPEDEALAHCISEDCRMGAGIAVKFKKTFCGVDELKKQKKVPGQCAVLKRYKRFVYYLITKEKYSHKPTYDSLRKSLEDMKSHCLQNGVTGISMPRIGCGLDGLSWDKVEEMLEQVFQPTDIRITVYTLPVKPTRKPSPRVTPSIH